MDEDSVYEQYSSSLLLAFYFEIKTNIEKNILSFAMNQELVLIQKALKKKEVLILDNHPKRMKKADSVNKKYTL